MARPVGIVAMAAGGLSNILGTVFYNRAMATGSATAVTGLSACYPAITFVICAIFMGCAPPHAPPSPSSAAASEGPCVCSEKVNPMKILGVLLAAGSGVAFMFGTPLSSSPVLHAHDVSLLLCDDVTAMCSSAGTLSCAHRDLFSADCVWRAR